VFEWLPVDARAVRFIVKAAGLATYSRHSGSLVMFPGDCWGEQDLKIELLSLAERVIPEDNPEVVKAAPAVHALNGHRDIATVLDGGNFEFVWFAELYLGM